MANPSKRLSSLPSWAIAWGLLLMLAALLGVWVMLSPPPPSPTHGQVVLNLPSVVTGSITKDPFPVRGDRPQIAPSVKYAGAPVGTHKDYRVAIILTNLGLDPDLLAKANAELPKEVDFALRSDMQNLQATLKNLRPSGREVLLLVPMEPDGYPHNDPGPAPLLTSNTTEENLKRIAAHMEKAEGVIGLAPFMGKAFTRDLTASEPIASWISSNGYALLDFTNLHHRSQFALSAHEYGVTYIDNFVPLIGGPSDDHMYARKLDYMETMAKRGSLTVGVVEACPKAISFLKDWFKTFPEKKLLLTPVSSQYLPNLEGKTPPTQDLAQDPLPIQDLEPEPSQTKALGHAPNKGPPPAELTKETAMAPQMKKTSTDPVSPKLKKVTS